MRGPRVVVVVVVAAWLAGAAGCGAGDRPSTGDGGAADGGGVAPFSIASPAPARGPSPPACPTGWRRAVVDEGVEACDAFGEAGRARCAGAEAHFPGEPGCAPVGSPCPADGWPADLPAAAVLYVRAGASGGDGTRAAPFARVGDALARAASGTTVAIAAGRYDGSLVIPGGVALRGACAADTQLLDTTPSTSAGVVTAGGAMASAQELTLSGARPGAWIEAGTSLRLERVVIDGAAFVAVAANGGSVQLESVLVRGTTALADGRFGRGLEVAPSAAAQLTRVAFEDNRDTGIMVQGAGASLLAASVVVSGTSRPGGPRGGAGLAVQTGARARLSGFVAQGSSETGILAGGGEVSVELGHVVVRATGVDPADVREGVALQVVGGASVEGAGLLVEGTTAVGAHASQAGAELRLSDTVVRDTRLGAESARSLSAQLGGALALARVAVLDVDDVGLIAVDGGTVDGEDLIVRRTRPGMGLAGEGVLASAPARITLRRIEVREARRAGIMAQREGAELALEDATIADTTEVDGSARGLYVINGARATVARARVSRSGDIGVFVANGNASLGLEDVTVIEGLPRSESLRFGRGVGVQLEATLSGRRVLIADARELGFYGAGAGARASFVDLAIARTARAACLDTTCPDTAFGVAMGVYDGATASATAFLFSESALCAVQLAGGEADLSSGEIARNPIGINVQTAGFDFERVTTGVAFVDNERNVDAATLPIPDTLQP